MARETQQFWVFVNIYLLEGMRFVVCSVVVDVNEYVFTFFGTIASLLS